MATSSILPVSSSVITAASRPLLKQVVETLHEETTRWIREVFELPTDVVLLPGSFGSLGCPLATTLRAWGVKNVWVMERSLRYSDSDGNRRTVVFSPDVKRFIEKFDRGLSPELIDQSPTPVVYAS